MSSNIYPSYGLSGTSKNRGISGSTKNGKNCLDVSVFPGAFSTGGQGRKAVAVTGTAIALSATSVACSKVMLFASTDNANPLYVGFSGVNAGAGTQTGALLLQGGGLELEVTDLNLIFINGSAGDVVTYLYV